MFMRRILSTALFIICYNACLSVEYDTLRFDDGSYALLCRKWPPNYYDLSIDSISIERKTFTAIYDGCGKGSFFLKEKDLNLIKETSVYEDIHCYYIIQDGDERMPVEEPTALNLRQNGRRFYITCSKQSEGKWDNVCDLPKDTPLIFRAYLFNLHCGKEIYQEVIIYQIETP